MVVYHLNKHLLVYSSMAQVFSTTATVSFTIDIEVVVALSFKELANVLPLALAITTTLVPEFVDVAGIYAYLGVLSKASSTHGLNLTPLQHSCSK